MSDGAKVTNVEALERFRSSLAVYVERANSILDEVGEEVKRTRVWLQTEQKLRLAHEIKRRERQLELLEQEMFTARLSNLGTAKTGAQMQINKKRRELRELEDKVRAVAAWTRNYDSTVETEARKAEKLRFVLDGDMKKGMSFLTETVRLLDEYSGASAPPPPSVD